MFTYILDLLRVQARSKRREASWTLTKKLDTFAGPGEIKRREVVLDVELGPESWTSFALVVTQQQCCGPF